MFGIFDSLSNDYSRNMRAAENPRTPVWCLWSMLNHCSPAVQDVILQSGRLPQSKIQMIVLSKYHHSIRGEAIARVADPDFLSKLMFDESLTIPHKIVVAENRNLLREDVMRKLDVLIPSSCTSMTEDGFEIEQHVNKAILLTALLDSKTLTEAEVGRYFSDFVNRTAKIPTPRKVLRSMSRNPKIPSDLLLFLISLTSEWTSLISSGKDGTAWPKGDTGWFLKLCVKFLADKKGLNVDKLPASYILSIVKNEVEEMPSEPSFSERKGLLSFV